MLIGGNLDVLCEEVLDYLYEEPENYVVIAPALTQTFCFILAVGLNSDESERIAIRPCGKNYGFGIYPNVSEWVILDFGRKDDLVEAWEHQQKQKQLEPKYTAEWVEASKLKKELLAAITQETDGLIDSAHDQAVKDIVQEEDKKILVVDMSDEKEKAEIENSRN